MAKAKKNAAEQQDGNENEAPEGFTQMFHVDCNGITIDGEAYEVVDGEAYIANDHVAEAVIHGFTTKRPQ